jgi:hypothetical protein
VPCSLACAAHPVLQPRSGRKRKRRPTNTPEGEIGQPSSGGKQKNTSGPSNGLEAEGASLTEVTI